MAENNFRTENGLLLSDVTMVEFENGCSDSMAIVPGTHEIGAEVPCPDCAGEHRIVSALPLGLAHNVEIAAVEIPTTEVEPEEEIED